MKEMQQETNAHLTQLSGVIFEVQVPEAEDAQVLLYAQLQTEQAKKTNEPNKNQRNKRGRERKKKADSPCASQPRW